MTAFYCFTLQELSPAVGVCYNFFVLFFFFPLWEFVLVMIWVAFQVQTLFGVPLTFYPFLVFHVGLRMHWKPHWLTTPSYDRSYYCNSRLFLNPADIYIIQNIDAPSIQFLPLIKFKVAQGEEPIPAVTQLAHPGQATDGLRRMTIHAHIKSKAKFKSPTICMCINCGATRTSTERTGRLHRSQRAGGFKPRVLLLWCDTADHHTTVPSSHWHVGTWLSKALPPLSSQIYTGTYWTHWFPFL